MATTEQFQALFDPEGVVVAGVSSHPGKFGFVALHNILASGYRGQVFGTNRECIEVLGVQTLADADGRGVRRQERWPVLLALLVAGALAGGVGGEAVERLALGVDDDRPEAGLGQGDGRVAGRGGGRL